ncbi:MerR family transcriptional regulator [Lentzea sp. PSKA42]|jgi:MerR family transcriptional regulator, thiopeptide resistance regulator|uniref:MerR family transcriptional regulator n=1 Tax=Lentzea indica TaxID=2604800 RepID=A0ABX1FUW6_9PSEU|nr:MerR family transcriptional regulator [Lentzea indica]NKE62281.1 MerR family transcriptional regulator [Lentzea indica]
MAWSIAQVARMSKVTSRTLRHYDSIGLLPPAWIGDNGYRYYEKEQVHRLQQILLLRDLGLGLDVVADMLNGTDQLTILRNHHRWLQDERQRLDRLANTVARTIEELEGGDEVKMEELFDGFDAAKQKEYEAQLVDRFGDGVKEHIASGKKRWQGATKADADSFMQEWQDVVTRATELFTANTPVDAPEAVELVERHHRWICLSWTPNKDSYAGLAGLYLEDEFKPQLDVHAEGTAQWMHDAMTHYAQTRL